MSRRSSRAPSVALAAALALVGACGSSPDTDGATGGSDVFAHDRAAGPVVIRGTALAAGTGRPLAGVLVEGPGGVRTHTDDQGRFVLTGLTAGTAGELRGTSEGGLVAVNRLRPLKAGELEVVLRLR